MLSINLIIKEFYGKNRFSFDNKTRRNNYGAFSKGREQ